MGAAMRIPAAILISLAFSACAVAASSEEEVARYVNIFSGDKSLHAKAADSLGWMGISDTRVFDVVERRLLEDYETARDKVDRHRISWYIRALGFSGQAKYTPTLDKLVEHADYGRHARNALEDIPHYGQWNAVISNRAAFNPKYTDDVNRVMNMLRSDDFLLKRVGAKSVYFRNQEDELLDLLAEQVKASYARNDRQYSDSIAWMVKALGKAKKEKYKPLFEEMVTQAEDREVCEQARGWLCKIDSGRLCSSTNCFLSAPR